MKFIVVILVVLAGIWLWRARRQGDPKLHRRKPPPAAVPLEMGRCTLCAVHFPLVDAVHGNKGLYCCTDHLQRAES